MKRNKFMRFARVLVFAVFIITCASSVSFAATYYVATTGNDSNAGTLSSPFRTVQKGLNTLQPGDTCIIRGGTYNEALVMGQSGTSTAPITIVNYTGETITINSGSSKALRTGGNKHYYTIDGIRFISSHTVFDAYGGDYTLDFGDGVWGGDTDPNAGNNGFILRNCYIEGAIYIYGHYNLVENCELNGKSIWGNGIWERSAASHHNIYRKNTVYDYVTRGIWSMQNTTSVLIQGNTVHGTGAQAINCDGALHPTYSCTVRGNTVYNAQIGVSMENGFNSVVEKNIIYNSSMIGISYINYGTQYSDAEYRTTSPNAIIRNNLIYNSTTAGIMFYSSPGNKIYNNTIYNTTNTGGMYGGISLTSTGGYASSNTDVKNNILVQNNPYAIFIDAGTGMTLNNNLYYHSSKTVTHYVSGSTNTLAQYQSKTGQDLNSVFKGPGFVNPTVNDFHLSSTSPAVNTGTTLVAVSEDLNSVSRPQGAGYDIGAYELPTGQKSIPAPPQILIIR